MPGKIKVSSTFRSVTSVRLKTSTGWGTVTKGFIKVAGQWKQWYSIPLRDAFTRTTSGNLGTSESFFSWSSLFGTWFANGSQAQSNNAVSSGTAGALSYLDIGTTDAVTSVGVTTGTGPAFWITAAGSWWGAVTTSDQTDTTYTYPCNCVCNGHNQTTCNTCTNPAFGTYSCPTTYPATGGTTAVLQGNATLVTTTTDVGAATPVYSTQNQGPASVTSSTTYSHVGGSTSFRYCPGGESQYSCSGNFFSTQCYTLTYSCPANQYYNSNVNMCYWQPQYGNYPSGATPTCSGTYYIASIGYNCDGLSCGSGQTGPVPGSSIGRSQGSCYCGTVTNSYSCAAYPGSTLNGTDCFTNVLTGYTCPSGQTVSGSRCVTSSTSYSCSAFPGSYLSGTQCYTNVTSYSCPSGGTLSGTTCTIAATCNNSGTSCEYCGSTTTFISGGTYPNCDSYGSTCQTCTAGGVVTNYYLQIIYSTSTGASYSVYSTSSGLSAQPATIGVTTSGNTATVVPRTSGGTSLGTFTATNTGTKGNNVGIVKSYGNYAQGSTADNFSSDQA
jgi:hypothetical protein